MNRRQILVLAILFLAAAGGYFWKQSGSQKQVHDLYTALSPSLEEDKVSSITAWVGEEENMEKGVVIQRHDGKWKITRREGGDTFWARAKQGKVERLISSLSGLKGDFRAGVSDVLDSFHISDKEGLHILVKDGDEILLHMIVGKKGDRWDTSYVRLAGSDKVYLVEKNLLSLFDIWSQWPVSQPSPRPWTDLTVISGLPKDVAALSYERGDLSWALSRVTGPSADSKGKEDGGATGEHGEWEFTMNGKKVRKSDQEVKRLLDRLMPLHATDVTAGENAKGTGLGPGEIYGRLTIHFKQSGIEIYHVGHKNGKGDKGWIRDKDGEIFVIKGEWIDLVENPFKESEEKKEEVSRPSGPEKG